MRHTIAPQPVPTKPTAPPVRRMAAGAVRVPATDRSGRARSPPFMCPGAAAARQAPGAACRRCLAGGPAPRRSAPCAARLAVDARQQRLRLHAHQAARIGTAQRRRAAAAERPGGSGARAAARGASAAMSPLPPSARSTLRALRRWYSSDKRKRRRGWCRPCLRCREGAAPRRRSSTAPSSARCMSSTLRCERIVGRHRSVACVQRVAAILEVGARRRCSAGDSTKLSARQHAAGQQVERLALRRCASPAPADRGRCRGSRAACARRRSGAPGCPTHAPRRAAQSSTERRSTE